MSIERQPGVFNRAEWTWQRLARYGLIILAIYVVGWLLYHSWTDLVPFIFGLVLAYLLNPLVRQLTRWMPKWAAILVVYVVGLGALVLAVMTVVPPAIRQLQSFATQIPTWYEEQLQPQAEEWLGWYRTNIPPNVQETIDEQIAQAQESLRANASEYASRITTGLLTAITSVFRTLIFLLGFLIIPFWLFYVLKDSDDGKRAIDRLVPLQIRADFWAIVGIFDRIFSSYIRGQLVLGLVVGVAVFIGLSLLNLFGINIDYILLLSLIAGITELIPVIGPILGAIPGIIVGFATGGTTGGIAAALVYIVVQQLENNVLVPRIIGGIVEIHPAMLMVLLVVAAAIWGLVGVILVAPVAAVARDVYLYLYRRLKETDPSERDEPLPELPPEPVKQPEQVMIAD